MGHRDQPEPVHHACAWPTSGAQASFFVDAPTLALAEERPTPLAELKLRRRPAGRA